jgi:hypothetical protein
VRDKVLKLLECLKDEKVVATAIFSTGTDDVKGWIWLLAILQDYSKLVRYVFEKDLACNISLVTVDKVLFEKDVKHSFLGDLVAEKLILPYTAINGLQYLKDRENYFKRKIVTESTLNLILEFSELSKGLQIEPEYFPLD